jgi:hypothetical protein
MVTGAYLQAGEGEWESAHNRVELMMTHVGGSPVPAIRHLLQGADPIPVFSKVPPGASVGSFFRDYLLGRGSIAVFHARHACFRSSSASAAGSRSSSGPRRPARGWLGRKKSAR